MTWLIVLAVLLVVFLAFGWWTDRRRKGPREPTASPFNPSNVRDSAIRESLKGNPQDG